MQMNFVLVQVVFLSIEKSAQSMNDTNAQGLFMIQSSALEMVWKNVSCGLRLRHLEFCLISVGASI